MSESDEKPPERTRPRSDGSGDSSAYLRGDQRIFREVDGWVRAEVRKRYPSLRDEEEDLVQIVHAKLVDNLRKGRFRHESTLRSYVSGILNYSAIDRLRVRYRDNALSELWDPQVSRESDNPYLAIEAMDEDRLLQQVVMALPVNCIELWRLVFVERLPYEAIARRLSVPVGTVKSRMWHCRQKAAEQLRRIREGGGPPDH